MSPGAAAREPAFAGEAARGPAAVAVTRRRRLASNVLWLLTSNVLYSCCQWGAVVALAKLAPPASLGYFGLALAVTNPVILLTGFSLKAYQSTDVRGRYAFPDYVNLRLGANVVAGAIIGVIAIIGVVGAPEVAVLIPIAVAKLSDATSETCYGLAQKHDRMRFVALSKTARGAIGLAALVAVVGLGGTVAQGAWALATTWVVLLLTVDFRGARALEPVLGRPDPRVIWRLVRDTAPLGVVAGAEAMTQSVPRYLLQLTEGATSVGYYTAVSAVVPALSQLAGALGNGAAPSLGWTVSTDTRRFRGLVARLVGAGVFASVALALGAAALGRWFLTLAYGPDYAAFQGTFLLLSVAAGLGVINIVTYFALVAARRVSLLLTIECLGLLVTGAVAAALVRSFGLGGVATGAALGAAVMAVFGVTALLREGRGR
jgi:O-antigen/teichoic acid export membrane protein